MLVRNTNLLCHFQIFLSGVHAASICGILDQRSAIVRDTLYFSSGNYTFDDGQSWHNTSNLYALPLNATLDVGGPLPLSLLNQSPLPSNELVGGNGPIHGGSAGTYFYDHTTLYAYGGLVGGTANATNNALWSYNTTSRKWELAIVQGGQLSFGDDTEGVWANDPAHSLSFYTGGYTMAYNNTNNGIVRLDTSNPSTPQWSFQTAVNSMQGPNILKGVMAYVRKGRAGILVAFGGYNTTEKGTEFAAGWDWDQRPLDEIFVYDIFSNVWYLVIATGDVPSNRAEFCAGVSSAPDDSSFQITIHGGYDQFRGVTLSDVYVLSLPSFTWIQVDASNNPEGDLGRNRHKCNMYNDGQMIVNGGLVEDYNSKCNQSLPPIKVLDTSIYIWRSQFQPDLNYSVPDTVSAVIGGNSSGNAKSSAPLGGWNGSDLEAIFKITVPRDPYSYDSSTNVTESANNTMPNSNNSTESANPTASDSTHHSQTGTIAGGVVAGVVVVTLIGVSAYCIARRRRRRRRPASTLDNQHQEPYDKAELSGNEIKSGSKSKPAELEGYQGSSQLPTMIDRAELQDSSVVSELEGATTATLSNSTKMRNDHPPDRVM